MSIEIEKSFTVAAPAAEVWAFLIDPERVASCLPGAAVTDQVDETTYKGTMAVKVGPVSAKYRGKMTFERLDADAMEAEIKASGQEVKGKGGADMKMSSRVVEKGPRETEVVVTSAVDVVGVLAQFGRGMIEDVSDIMFQQFTEAMRSQLEGDGAGDVEAPASEEAPADGSPAEGAAEAAPSEPEGSPAAGTPADEAPAPGTPAAAAMPEPESKPRESKEDALDVGALGATVAKRAAGRMLARPGFWVAVVVLLALVWLLFLR